MYMKILVIEPNKKPYVKEIDGSHESIKKIVENPMEIICPFLDAPSICLASDAFGKLKSLKFNRALTTKTGDVSDVIAGTFVLFNTPVIGDGIIDLTSKQIQTYTKRFEKTDTIVYDLNRKHNLNPAYN